MTAQRPRIRALTSRDPEISDFARDVQREFDSIPQLRLVQFTDIYAEPLRVALDRAPAMLLCSVRKDSAPEDVIGVTQSVSFNATPTGVSIPSLAGLTLATRYRFTFLAVG
ncbi:MAG TPA: hypothetical protein VHM19_22890 [Polyangiales bacterium]|jgi:hypothetical protein|nr:hypothetical protein [Polyangiales bacterium]